jgi:hypothetical protein
MIVRFLSLLVQRCLTAAYAGAFVFVVGALIHSCSPAWADEQAGDKNTDTETTVSVFVRAIESTVPVSAGESEADRKIDTALLDLAPKLSQLPFASFRLLASKRAQLSLRKRESILLPNGHSLAFRPVYLEGGRVALWLSWRDRLGADILNTRIHFDATDAVLTGTDGEHNGGFLLAIKAVPHLPAQ